MHRTVRKPKKRETAVETATRWNNSFCSLLLPWWRRNVNETRKTVIMSPQFGSYRASEKMGTERCPSLRYSSRRWYIFRIIDFTHSRSSDKSYTWSHSNNTNTLCCGLVHAVLITQSAYYSSTLRWNRIYISFRLCASYTIRQRIHHHMCNKNVRECVFFANLSLFHFYFL